MATITRTIGFLLKVAGFLGMIYGLLTFALAGMDNDPRETMLWGVLITGMGLVILYCGFKVTRAARRA